MPPFWHGWESQGSEQDREEKDRWSAGSLPLPILCQHEHHHQWEKGHSSAPLATESELTQGHEFLTSRATSIWDGSPAGRDRKANLILTSFDLEQCQ